MIPPGTLRYEPQVAGVSVAAQTMSAALSGGENTFKDSGVASSGSGAGWPS